MQHQAVGAVVMGDLNLLRAVGRAGLGAVVITSGRWAAYSRYCGRLARIAPAAGDPEGAAGDLVDLGRALAGRPVLYYSNDAQLRMVSRYREPLAACYRFLLPDAQLVEDLLDKERFQRLAERLGLDVPPRAHLDAAAASQGHGWVIKPASRIGWGDHAAALGLPRHQKAIRVRTVDDLHRWTEMLRGRGARHIVQDFVPGGDDALYSFHAYLDERSRPLGWFVGRKIRTWPLDTGGSTHLEVVDDRRLADQAVEVLQRLGYRGVVKMDFKRDAECGRNRLLEINARFNLWHYLGAVAGVNVPAIAHAHLVGRPVPSAPGYRTGVHWVSVRDDLRAARAGLRAGRWTIARILGSYAAPAVYAVFAWRDPFPALVALTVTLVDRLRSDRRPPAPVGASPAPGSARPLGPRPS